MIEGKKIEGWDIIQRCELSPGTGLYGKRKFIAAIDKLSSNDFDQFCRSYLHLLEFYTLHKNTWFTNVSELIEKILTHFGSQTKLISIAL